MKVRFKQLIQSEIFVVAVIVLVVFLSMVFVKLYRDIDKLEMSFEPEKVANQDTDIYGCPKGPGDVYSSVLGQCINYYREGLQIQYKEQPNIVVYMLLSIDLTRAEVFIPASNSTLLLNKADPNEEVWTNKDYTLMKGDTGFVLTEESNAGFKE